MSPAKCTLKTTFFANYLVLVLKRVSKTMIFRKIASIWSKTTVGMDLNIVHYQYCSRPRGGARGDTLRLSLGKKGAPLRGGRKSAAFHAGANYYAVADSPKRGDPPKNNLAHTRACDLRTARQGARGAAAPRRPHRSAARPVRERAATRHTQAAPPCAPERKRAPSQHLVWRPRARAARQARVCPVNNKRSDPATAAEGRGAPTQPTA